ncbi:MAG: hypothetical protein ACRD3W_24535 [Terriglobales bacterium]
MIAFSHDYQSTTPAWHAGFLTLLPQIRESLRFSFRKLPPSERTEAMAEAVASTAIAYARLYERGKLDVAFATTLASYAVKHYFAGRRVGSKLNANDVSSAYAQRMRGFVLKSLDPRAPNGEWRETLVEDKTSGPAEIAAARLDVDAWFAGMTRLKRAIGETLASGESTFATAKRFDLTPGRVSQVRKELAESWADYQGESLACT